MIYIGEMLSGQDALGLNKGPIIAWLSFEIIFNFGQAFELIFDIYANGSIKKAFSRKSRCVIEAVCQVINLIGVIMILGLKIDVDDYYHVSKPFEMIIFIRLLKLVPLLAEVRSYSKILLTMSYMLDPI